MANIVKVGMADLNVCKSPESITTLGLGSCVGICIRDPVAKIGGLAHAMLPDSRQIENNANRAKFADTGIEDLVKKTGSEDSRRGADVCFPEQIGHGACRRAECGGKQEKTEGTGDPAEGAGYRS